MIPHVMHVPDHLECIEKPEKPFSERWKSGRMPGDLKKRFFEMYSLQKRQDVI